MTKVIANKGEEWIINGKEVVVNDFYTMPGDDEEHIEIVGQDGVVQVYRLSEWVALSPVLKHDLAWDFYVDALNQTRHTVSMATRTDKLPQQLDPKTQTKHAIMKVLSTGAWLEAHEVKKLILDLGITKAPSTIREALRRIVKFGLADVQKNHNRLNRYGRASWKMTQRGLQYVNAPPQPKPVRIKKVRIRVSKKAQVSAASAAPGGTTMCIDPNKPSLNASIEHIVGQLVLSKNSFSAYNVTKELRDKVNSSSGLTIDPNETGTVYIHGQQVAYINHDYVRDAVHELFHQGKMSGYDRRHNGSYWEYVEAATTQVAPAATTSTPVPPTAGSNYDGTPTL